jgi:hypothetical protein
MTEPGKVYATVALGFEVMSVYESKIVTKSLEMTWLIAKRVILERWY